jgi:hypothetical protein
MIKSVVIAEPSKAILYLSATYEGSKHDKTIAEQEDLEFGKPLRLLQDLGFLAYEPDGVEVVIPTKKPRKKELTTEQKADNRQKASERVVVEHAIGGVKIWRIVKETIRSWSHRLRDQVMYLACGLHNFRLKYRNGSYKTYSV